MKVNGEQAKGSGVVRSSTESALGAHVVTINVPSTTAADGILIFFFFFFFFFFFAISKKIRLYISA